MESKFFLDRYLSDSEFTLLKCPTCRNHNVYYHMVQILLIEEDPDYYCMCLICNTKFNI